ncbi:hypothetical protein [Persicitalea jodogahamensis]|uniref:Transmembrane protein n=1 Tax=Persicitalea jodogahamensis TaxID=402147 RepID=A0A8J3D8R5_9BACT|nr:hypothetical protein [Persicitalea jodogahamensis]GHB69397.1 hypothetical protein GCM10007390_23700 [Persicitalea jodogahamensis]
MRVLGNYLIILVATALLQFFMPWWTIAVVPFLVCLWRSGHPAVAYAVSLAAVSTVWLAYATFIHNSTQGNMSDRIAELFSLPSGTALLFSVTLLSGLVAGFAGMAGYYVRQLFVKEPLTIRT